MEVPAGSIVYHESPGVDNDTLNTLFRAAWPDHADRDYLPLLARSLGYVVAYEGERVVGFVNVATDGGEHAFLLDPTVDPAFRRMGIGTHLVGLARELASRRGCRWLHVDFAPDLAPFYERAGFRPTAAGLIELTPVVEEITPPLARAWSPFATLRARGLLVQCAVGSVAATLLIRLFDWLVPGLDITPSGGPGAYALIYLGVGLVLAGRIRASHLNVGRLFGPPPGKEAAPLLMVVAPVGILSLAGFWLLFLPLSYVTPEFVRRHGLENPALRPETTLPSWCAMLIVTVLLAPFFEEVLFRGLLLQRWAYRWGTPVAVVATSALFAVMHVEIIGHFVFGVVMCALYLRTRSLWVSIATHALNNFLVSLLSLPDVLTTPAKPDVAMSLGTFRSQWWVGLLLLIVGAGLLEAYRQRFWRDVDLRSLFRGPVPYEA